MKIWILHRRNQQNPCCVELAVDRSSTRGCHLLVAEIVYNFLSRELTRED